MEFLKNGVFKNLWMYVVDNKSFVCFNNKYVIFPCSLRIFIVITSVEENSRGYTIYVKVWEICKKCNCTLLGSGYIMWRIDLNFGLQLNWNLVTWRSPTRSQCRRFRWPFCFCLRRLILSPARKYKNLSNWTQSSLASI